LKLSFWIGFLKLQKKQKKYNYNPTEIVSMIEEAGAIYLQMK
jgi:hypothetical protein